MWSGGSRGRLRVQDSRSPYLCSGPDTVPKHVGPNTILIIVFGP